MPYVLARSWKGQVLPPGALGYPKNHPNVFSYARPRYFKGRGFRGLGQVMSPYSDYQTFSCNPLNVAGCGASDLLVISDTCGKALQACFYASNAPGASAGLNINAPSNPSAPLPPTAGPISTTELQQQMANP